MVNIKLGLFSLLPFASAYWALTDPKTDHATRGVFEVDLIFPREGTFSPTNTTPIIFAVQNPQRAKDLGAYIIWTLVQPSNATQADGYNIPGLREHGVIELGDLNISTISNPYLAWDRITAIGDTEDSWDFEWTIRYSNCTEFYTERNTTVIGVEHGISSYSINITTKRTAPQSASLETAFLNDTCRVGDYFNLNVTRYNLLPGGDPEHCSELGDPVTEENRNCRIGSDAKEAVKAEFAYQACKDALRYPLTSANCTKPGEPQKVPAKPVVPSMATHDMHVSISWMFAALLGLGAFML
jgi:hypothetical protein